LSFLVDGELEKPNAVDRDGLWPDSPKAGGLDMRHRLPGHFGRFGRIVAVDADRCVRGFLNPHLPEWTSRNDETRCGTARKFSDAVGDVGKPEGMLVIFAQATDSTYLLEKAGKVLFLP
jgi:hypothetical protein